MRKLALSLTATIALTSASLAVTAMPAFAGYGARAIYQVEISANIGGPDGGGIWLWIELDGTAAGGTGDYAGSDCGHGFGAAADRGDVSWVKSGATLTISGVALNGFGPTPLPIVVTVPSAYGHYATTFGATFTGLPPFVPAGGPAQVQVAP